ncbi:MAG: inositol monophosphatase [Candidatus Nanohaloarchaeota archaeon QJJ-7]|nr:inositol monophosphatase [Candidatus Nanohaloarchaeota archaeon QJJ-7]
MKFERELEVAKEAARKAGEVMEHYQENGFSVERKKTYNDLVTEADHEAQEVIVETIEDEFPEDGFLAEENDLRPEGEERVWVIDPIDGTKNFTHGFPFYCSSIALKEAGDVKVGAIISPPRNEFFTAVRGEGAWLDGEKLEVSEVGDLKDSLIIARISDMYEEERDIETDFLRDLLQQPSTFRRPGSAALDLGQVAAGRADGHALVAINEWDIAAGTLLIEEAGGTVRVQDSDVVDGYLEIVDSNGRIQDSLMEVFDRYARDQDRS